MTKEEKEETPVDTRTTGTEDGGVDHDGDDGGSKKPKKRKSKKKRSSSTTADAAAAAAAEVTAAEAAAGVGDEETTDAEKPPPPPKKKKSKRKSTKSLKESEGVGGGGESSRSLNADGDGDDDDKLERKASIKKKKKKSSRSLTVEDEDDGEGGRRSSRSLTADGDGGGGSSRSLSKKKKKKRTSTTSAASGEDGGEIETGDESKPKSTKKKKKKSKRDITKEEGEEEEAKDGSNKKLMVVATDNIETDDKKATKEKESHVEHNIHGNDGGLVLTTSESFQEESELLLKYNDFWCRQSKRVARAPCIHFWVSFVISMILSGIAMTIGEFSVSANNAGWQSRGTLISDRQTQVMLVEFNAQYLFYGGNDAWKDLINNVQPGWEDDDDTVDDRRRRGLELASSPMEIGDYHDELSATSSYWGDMIIPKADRIHPHLTMDPSSPNKESFFLPISMKTAEGKDNNTQIMSTFMSQEEMTRKLQGTSLLQSCDISWYNLPTMTSDHRLWPVWKTKVIPKSKPKTFASAFDSDVLRDLCIAEMNTLMLLEEKELCFGCDDGKTWVSGGLHTGDDPIEHTCLPPYSIVLYARFQVQDHTFKLSCDELATKWESVRDANHEQFLKCVHDIRTIYSPTDPTLPESCPWGFETTMVDEFFGGGEMSDNNKDNKDEDSQTTDEEQVIRYTSSIFPTTSDVLQDLYDNYDDLDTASKSKVVEGAYGTQWEGLIQIHLDASVSRDMSLATGSAFIVALAIVVHTKSLFLTLVGLLQIILSFPLAFFVYKFVAGFDFFPFLNFIGIFVLFALGANDVFVAVDKWKNARLQYPSESVELVAAVAFPDASGAMFQTTLTTAVAFFATALGPVAPIQMFAFFVGLLVLFDYLMNVILVFPALCIYDKSIQNAAVSGRRPNCCITWACCKSGNEEEVAAHHHEHQQHEHELHKKLQQAEDDVEKQDIKKNGEEEEEEEVRPSLIHRILLGYYYLLHRARWGLLVACAVALILSIIFAAQLTLPLSSDVRVLQEDVPFEQAYMWRKKLLYTALDSIRGSRASVIWGVVPADTGTLSKFESVICGENQINPVTILTLLIFACCCLPPSPQQLIRQVGHSLFWITRLIHRLKNLSCTYRSFVMTFLKKTLLRHLKPISLAPSNDLTCGYRSNRNRTDRKRATLTIVIPQQVYLCHRNTSIHVSHFGANWWKI